MASSHENRENMWKRISNANRHVRHPWFDYAARVIAHEAEADETWDLDELDVQCFSLCLPVKGDMHNDQGVLARKESFASYCAAFAAVIEEH